MPMGKKLIFFVARFHFRVLRDANVKRGNLNEFILADVFDAVVQAHILGFVEVTPLNIRITKNPKMKTRNKKN